MPIIGQKIGDITSPIQNPERDIIIGMNQSLKDVRGIGRDALAGITHAFDLSLGSVITFPYDARRNLHMIICHSLGEDGWTDAEKYVRFGLDFLWQQNDNRKYSIVQIGTGRVGRRDGADAAAIHTAIATSYLPVLQFIVKPDDVITESAVLELFPQPPSRVWDRQQGEMQLDWAA